jgi:hypothetical protein
MQPTMLAPRLRAELDRVVRTCTFVSSAIGGGCRRSPAGEETVGRNPDDGFFSFASWCLCWSAPKPMSFDL